MTLNIYMEARGEPINTQLAVAAVTMNRVKRKEYSNSVCRVVYQKGQFTWNKKGKVKEKETFQKIKKLARSYLAGRYKNRIGKRLYFNHYKLGRRYKTPYRMIRIGKLVFY